MFDLRHRFFQVDVPPLRTVILAAHPDDDVAMAGGWGTKVQQLGGQVWIVYTCASHPDAAYARQRVAEGREAWALSGVKAEAIIGLDYMELTGLAAFAEVKRLTEELQELLAHLAPEVVILPAYEGGHWQHDATHFAAVAALSAQRLDCLLLEAPLYNCYYSLLTVRRNIRRLGALISPRWRGAPPFLDWHGVKLKVRMSRADLLHKRAMLDCFRSQNPAALKAAFGYPDRFQLYTCRDYSRPAWDYEASLAPWINRGRQLMGRAPLMAIGGRPEQPLPAFHSLPESALVRLAQMSREIAAVAFSTAERTKEGDRRKAGGDRPWLRGTHI